MADTTEAVAGPAGRGLAAKSMLMTFFWDFGPAVLGYFGAELLGASTYVSLLAGTVLSGLRLVWVAVRDRRLEPFALFLMIMFGVGLLLTFVTGDVRFVLAKDSATTAVSGLALLGSCVLGRPLVYYAAQRMAVASGRTDFAETADTPVLRRRWYQVSLVWGFGLLAESIVRIVAVYALPLGVAANLSQVLMIAVVAALLTWTIRSGKRLTTASVPAAR
ncbi:VC0807 family protein [Amycolatopsis sp. PS_44_ISF1]|uniref:VC0807 family protein n=1 Tax=Amycolatopsis sp. PS_44_ISF1 TaxID=2974917 RepID=UPI0028DD4C76|nr:VC0807 family protein [Amycolatopsis sp. PS_44_ISF1]MDT8913309.1 hypothetical protein [Amycolatopsis sp. PS_44_ISF1]